MLDLAVAIVLASLVATAGYVYAPILRMHAGRTLHVPLPANSVAPGSPAVMPPPIELPAKVEALCNAESEGWAKAAARETARVLYAQSGNWDAVLVEMELNS